MTNNTQQLPAEVSSKIEQQAHDAASSLYSPNNYNEFTSYQSGYTKGAIEYATKLHMVNIEKLNLQMTIKGVEDQLTVERVKCNKARALLEEALHLLPGTSPIHDKIQTFLDGTK